MDSTMKVWDVRKRTCIQTYTGHEKEITCLRFSPDGRWVASAAKDGQLLIWDLVAGKLLNSIRSLPAAYVNTFEFNPCELVLAASTTAKAIKFFDLDTMDVLNMTAPDYTPIRNLAYTGDGTTLCSTTKDSVKVYSWDTSAKLHATVDTNWDKVSDIKINGTTNELTATAINSNFISIWSIDIHAVLQRSANYQPSPPRSISGISGRRSPTREMQQTPPVAPNAAVKGPGNSGKSTTSASSGSRQKEAKEADVSLSYPFTCDVPVNTYLKEARNFKFITEDKAAAAAPSEGLSKEMATSMGDSFLKRLTADEELDKLAMEKRGNSSSSSRSKEVIESRDVLESLLPPSGLSLFKTKSTVADPSLSSKERVTQSLSPKIDVNKSRSNRDSNGINDNNRYDDYNTNNDYKEYKNSYAAEEISAKQHSPSSTKSLAQLISEKNNGEQSSGSSRNCSVVRSSSSNISASIEAPPKSISLISEELFHGSAIAGPRVTSVPISLPKHSDTTATTSSELIVLVEKILRNGSHTTTLSRRLASLKILKKFWEKGDLSSAIDHMHTLQEASVHDTAELVTLGDFLWSVELRGNGLNLEACAKLMPLFEAMLSSSDGWSSEHVVRAVLKSFNSLTEAFGELVKTTISNTMMHGAGSVDISREERIQRCKTCHHIMSRINVRLPPLKHQHRKNLKVLELIDHLEQLLYEKML